jgi:hypothetical protein
MHGCPTKHKADIHDGMNHLAKSIFFRSYVYNNYTRQASDEKKLARLIEIALVKLDIRSPHVPRDMLQCIPFQLILLLLVQSCPLLTIYLEYELYGKGAVAVGLRTDTDDACLVCL